MTRPIGSDAYNLKLSERRANAVRDYMVSRGIDTSRITTTGFGKADPVASNKTAEGRAKNRRVEITEE
jgi:OmpA-OmpF porin, OOP family